MKQIIKISLLMVVALAVLSACQNNSDLTAPESNVQYFNRIDQPVEGENTGRLVVPIYPIWEGRSVNAGFIRVRNDNENVYVTYYLHDDWQMNQSRLHVGYTINDVPVNEQGVPQPERFNYQVSMARGFSEFTQQIPLAELNANIGDDIFIFTNVDLIRNGSQKSAAGADKSPSVPQWWAMQQHRLRLSTIGIENVGRVKQTETLDQDLPG